MITPRYIRIAAFAIAGVTATEAATSGPQVAADELFARAAANGRIAAEGFERCHRYLQAWLRAADPVTGLIPRNLYDSPYWNGRDSAADNYPFMVLTAHFTDRAAFDGPMRRMLESERKLTVRPGWLRLTDEYLLQSPRGLRHREPDAARIIFESAEDRKSVV